MIELNSTIDILIVEEGAVRHRGKHVPYDDHLGYKTIGYGHLIDPRRGGGISEDVARYILKADIIEKTKELREHLEWFDDLDSIRQQALLLMVFQMGIQGVLRFKRMLAAMRNEEWEKAYVEAKDSKWYAQTPARAQRVATMIRKGESPYA